jgi:hypothetical protein
MSSTRANCPHCHGNGIVITTKEYTEEHPLGFTATLCECFRLWHSGREPDDKDRRLID